MPARIRHDATIDGDTVIPVHQETAPPDRNRITRVADSTGRVLGVRRPGALQELRLYEVVGPENSRNDRYLAIAGTVSAVVEIDGEICEPVATKRQLEARVQLLGHHGLLAVDGVFAPVEKMSPPPSDDTLAKE